MEVLNKKFQFFESKFYCLNRNIYGVKNLQFLISFFSALVVKKGKKQY